MMTEISDRRFADTENHLGRNPRLVQGQNQLPAVPVPRLEKYGRKLTHFIRNHWVAVLRRNIMPE